MIEEFARAHELRPEVFRRMQRYFQTEIGPKLEALQLENEKLREALAALRDRLEAVPVKRGRGRPRKAQLPQQEPTSV